MSKRKEVYLLILLIFLLVVINYRFIDRALEEFLDEKEIGIVSRVVDGDTAIINGNSTRFLGINTPEKGEKYYNEAKIFLESLILNKSVMMEYGKEKYDQYKRKLAFIFIDEKNINIEMVKKGFANIYLLGDKLHGNELENAWAECIGNKKNLCEESDDKCAECIELKKLDSENQEVIFYNKCSFDCSLNGWTIKDEGRKKFSFGNFILDKDKEIKVAVGNGTDSKSVLFWEGEDYVWTSTGDSLFLRDREGKLVLWEGY